MSIFQPIRARYEMAIRDALEDLTPAVPLYYDNVQEEPLDGGSVVEYATITISFPNITEPVICDEIGQFLRIRGNVQINMYTPRMTGMLRLEEMADAVICALMDINNYPDPDNVNTWTQSINGPIPVLLGNEPLGSTVVSAPFTARILD